MAYHFQEGNPPGICPRCGLKRNISDFRREWTGVRVCSDCYDPKHPQMNVRGVADKQQVPGGPMPEPPDVFVEPTAQTASTL